MARAKHLLTATGVTAAKQPGRYGDGNGLFLWVRAGGSKNWIVRVQKAGQRRDIGLGGFPKLSLADARKRAVTVHSQMEAGLDPVAERQRAAGVPTFQQAAAAVHAEHAKGWRNAKHGKQWLATLEAYAFPAIGELTVDAIDGGAIRDLLAPIWIEKPETARRVLQRIGVVLDRAHTEGHRPAEFPRRLILKGLPRQPKRDGHFEALPFADVPSFMQRLRERDGISRLALEALILTAARSGEIRGATWQEVDLERGLWTIPAGRMKAKAEHVVPLSPAAIDAFRRALPYRRTVVASRPDLVFPGMMKGKALSDMALTKLLRDMRSQATAHGFRSSFRDWVSECTNHPSEVAEMALAHAIPSKVEAAYRRGNLLEKRRDMMDAWARFAIGQGGKVVKPAQWAAGA